MMISDMPVFLLLILLILAAMGVAGCSSTDPRLPQLLYENALSLNQEGKTQEAKALMEEIVRRFPEKPEGMAARQDIFTFEALLKRSSEEKKKQVRQTVRDTCAALRRYKDKHGEYPATLDKLIPDYGLAQIPLTQWKHPLFYRPFVSAPTEETVDRRGRTIVRTNKRFDSYHLACLGKDLTPGNPASDENILVVNGLIINERYLPLIPTSQPFR